MTKTLRLPVVIMFAIIAFYLVGSASKANAYDGSPDQTKPAEHIFKNIQVLKGVPASQLQQIMAMFTGSLGVRCSYCHTNPFDKDDRANKQTARRMISMVLELNRASFGGRAAITCYTCHRGQTKPEAVVALGRNLFLPQPEVARVESPTITVDQILDRYVKVLGGKEALEKVTSRISSGSRIGADGVLVPEEVYQKAPNKMLITTTYPNAASIARVNAGQAWAGTNDKQDEVVGEELAELIREASFYKDASLQELYTNMIVAGKTNVGESEMYVIDAVSRSGNPEKLYFDVRSGLLVRRYRESMTVLGVFPLQVDFEDYQVVDGIRIPMSIRWSMPGRVWGRRIAQIKHNVPIDDSKFSSSANR